MIWQNWTTSRRNSRTTRAKNGHVSKHENVIFAKRNMGEVMMRLIVGDCCCCLVDEDSGAGFACRGADDVNAGFYDEIVGDC